MTRIHQWDSWISRAPGSFEASYTKGNSVELFVNASEFVPEMLEAIHRAKDCITFQFYGMEADQGGLPFADALTQAVGRGVSVKMIIDSVEIFLQTNGRWSFLPFQNSEAREERRATQRMLKEMECRGVEIFRYGWRYGLHRNHSKSLIIDNRTLFIGGFNPTEHNMIWHDLCAKAEGPVVLEVQKKFNEVFCESGYPGVSINSNTAITSDHANDLKVGLITNQPRKGDFGIKKFLLPALAQAKHSIWIENAYMADNEIMEMLIQAKHRGVQKVAIIVPFQSNHPPIDRRFRKQIPRLIDHGVNVYLYQGMTHAKVICLDDSLVSLGSANLNAFTLKYQNELNLVILDSNQKLSKELHERVFRPDLSRSTQVTKDNLDEFTRYQRPRSWEWLHRST